MDLPILCRADHDHFLEHGFVVLRGLVQESTIARVRSRVEASAAARARHPERPTDWTPTLMPCLDANLRHAVAELMPDRASELVSLTLQSRPYEPDASWSMRPPHVDGDYPTLMPNFLTLATLVFLTPARRHGGALVYFSGSHRRYRAAMARSFAAPKTGLPDLGRPLQLAAEPGDVIVFHHLFGHAISANVRAAWTRHAALAWWRAPERVVPGSRSFSRMSTVEKSNSARYLRRHFNLLPPLPRVSTDERTASRLAHGEPAPGVTAHAILQFRGMAHRLVATADAATIQLQTSRDLRRWRSRVLPLPPRDDLGPIRSIALMQWSADIVAVVGHAWGIRICTTRDLEDWRELAVRRGAPVCGIPHFNRNGVNATRFAEGCVLLHVLATDRSRLLCAWGPAWNDLSAGLSVAAQAPAAASFDDVMTAPVFGEFLFGLIADVRTRTGLRPMVALSDDSARYPGPLQPLRYSTTTAPARIRVYARAEKYWLVTYIRETHRQRRFFWGTIDWSDGLGRLNEIRTSSALREAFFVLGIR
jgi:hypothetical protein